jgi:glycosyltransferase involved in cell wall biosynthesis
VTEAPFVSVIVPARNSERTIGECVSSVLRADYPPERREVIVVDNGSSDRTAEIVRSYPVRYLSEPQRGPSAARNTGIESSAGEILAFVDSDCVATTGWLRALVREFDDAQVAAVAGEIVPYPPTTPAERYSATRKPRWQEPALNQSRPFAVTANVAFRRETFDRIGLFDPALVSAEDQDIGWRFFRAGLRLAYSPHALVLHRHRQTGWALFMQHAGWGYGHALLHRKYRLPWSLRHELRKQGELLVALAVLVRAGARYAARGGDRMDVYYPYFELLRRLGLRSGALYGLLDGFVRAR